MKYILQSRHVLFSIVLFLALTTLVFPQGTTITLLHVNDTHSHIDGFGPKDQNLNGTLGGIARAATIIGTVKATEPNVLLLHGGDLFQGDPFFNKYFGVPELQIMGQLGFDAMAVGNHEFGYGPDALLGVLSTAFPSGSPFPLLSANVDMTDYPLLTQWIQPSVIKTIGGVKIGIFGMTVPGDPMEMAAPVVIRENVVEIAQLQAAALRDSGVAVVIFLSHLGSYLDRIVGTSVTGIDFIIGAHDHYLFNQPIALTNPSGKQTLLFQAGQFYEHIGKLHFTVNNGTVAMNDYTMLALDASVPQEPSIQGVIDYLKEGITAQFGDLYHTVVGRAAHDLEKRFDTTTQLRDTPLGNLVADAFRREGHTDIGFTANGLISEKIYAGPIVGADVFRAMSYGYDPATGFGFKMATFNILGSDFLRGLELSLSQLEVGDDLCPQVSGMTFEYDAAKAVGHRVVDGSVKIDCRPLIRHHTYSVTSNSGLPLMLGMMGVTITDIKELPSFEFEVVKDYIGRLGVVDYRAEGRIRDKSVHEHCNHDLAFGNHGECSHNYPNPFNPSTTISCILPASTHVSLSIYNTLGQMVATLVNDDERAGTHEIRWNAGNAASGIYFYHLIAGSSVETRKMILAK
ncbi:MAG TPA: 5'-nucleotidase C-terminal domain-containing protein [Bacteroidota bacterium]|nr:5'-nucleotidase C-terminal domain-containing protein [Bacteroidota bacterium]